MFGEKHMSDTPTQEPQNEQQPVTPPVTDPGNQSGNEKLFTQADIDRIVGERASRAKSSAVNDLLSSIGLDSIDALKTLVSSAKEREEADLTEAQKIQRQLEQERQAKAQLEAQIAEIKAQQTANARRNAIVNAVQKAGATNADDLFILVNAKKGQKIESLFKDGEASDDELTAFIKEVQSDFPTYFGIAGAGSPSNAGGVPPTTKAKALEQAQREARKFGI